jgi:hypothetical protein
MADRLERSATPVVCFGDYVEFHHETAVRTVPERLDPYRLAYADEYPPGSLFRRSVIETIGGWRELGPVHTDHDLWMTIAERGIPAVHLGAGELSHRRRREPDPDSDGGWTQGARARAIARAAHPGLFAQVSDHRPISDRIRAPLDRLRSRAPQR